MIWTNVEVKRREAGSTTVLEPPSSETHRSEKQMLREMGNSLQKQLWRSGG